MSKNSSKATRRIVRAPATKFAHLRKKAAQARPPAAKTPKRTQ